MGFFSYLAAKLKRIAQHVVPMRLFAYGGIYQCTYQRYRHDSRPLIWVQFSGQDLTHGINLHYLNYYDKSWLGNTIISIKKIGQITDGIMFYHYLKLNRPSIIRTGYRTYKTQFLKGRLVSAGITVMDSLITETMDSFIMGLNKQLVPSAVGGGGIVAPINQSVLMERINLAKNVQPIQKQVVSPFGKAPWATT